MHKVFISIKVFWTLWCQTVTINTNQWQINETVRRQKRDRTVKMFVLLSFDSLTSSQQTFLNRWICKSDSTQYQSGAILNHSNTEALLTVFPKYQGLVIPTWRAGEMDPNIPLFWSVSGSGSGFWLRFLSTLSSSLTGAMLGPSVSCDHFCCELELHK